MPKSPNLCHIFGCNQVQKPGVTIGVLVEDESRNLKVCDYHQAFFEDFDSSMYAIGLTYLREVEVRLIPAQPTTPTPPEEEA